MIILRKLFSIQAHDRQNRYHRKYQGTDGEDLSIDTIDLPDGGQETVITDSRGLLVERIIKH